MAHTAYTLSLDADTWDLSVGADGSLKTVKSDSAILQNVANECRCFTNDLYFDRDRGIPWFDDQLGQKLRPTLTRANLRAAALSVDGVESVESITLTYLGKSDRSLRAEIVVITENGTSGTVTVQS
nr:MAG TPA: hypothetical protein [Caudoviricetes sp.]